MVYPALLLVICTPRLPVVDWTDAPADLNGHVRFAERLNLFYARVSSHFNWPLQQRVRQRTQCVETIRGAGYFLALRKRKYQISNEQEEDRYSASWQRSPALASVQTVGTVNVKLVSLLAAPSLRKIWWLFWSGWSGVWSLFAVFFTCCSLTPPSKSLSYRISSITRAFGTAFCSALIIRHFLLQFDISARKFHPRWGLKFSVRVMKVLWCPELATYADNFVDNSWRHFLICD